MRAFSLTLKAYGWRVFTCVVATPFPPRLILEALRAGLAKTTYVLRMDGDTRPIDDISRYVAEMRRERRGYLVGEGLRRGPVDSGAALLGAASWKALLEQRRLCGRAISGTRG
jgi:hypothetical protein